MKRKIEKYLSKKQGVDVSHIRYTDDGRFDFMGDLEGVLSAVRGKENSRSRTKSDRKPKRPKKKRDSLGPVQASKYSMYAGSMQQHPHPMYMHGMHPYMHSMHGPPPPMPHPSMPVSSRPLSKLAGTENSSQKNTNKFTKISDQSALSTTGKENESDDGRSREKNSHSAENKNIFACSPRGKRSHPSHSRAGPSFDTPGKSLQPPFSMNTGDFQGSCFEHTPNMEDRHSSMTPISNLRETFSTTPFKGDEANFFSPQTINKTLFGEDADENLESILKTPRPKSPICVKFQIGSDLQKGDSTEELEKRYRQVQISPISEMVQRKHHEEELSSSQELQESLAHVSISGELEHSLQKGSRHEVHEESISAKNCTPLNKEKQKNLFEESPMKSSPLMTNTPHNITLETADSSYHDISEASPFDPCSMLQTPGTADSKENGFWGRQLGFSPAAPDFTPLRSPTVKQDDKPDDSSEASVSEMLNDRQDDDRQAKSLCVENQPLDSEIIVPSPKRRKIEQSQ